MNTRFRSRELGTIQVNSVVEWLRRAAWSVKADGKGGLLCEGPLDDEGNRITRTLPQDESYGDYDVRLEDLVATLAVLEERPALQIVLEIAAARERGQVEPPRVPLAASDLLEIIRQSHGGVLSDEHWRNLDRELPALLENAILAVAQAESSSEAQVETSDGTIIAPVALVAVRIAHLLPVIELTKLALWRVCSRLLSDKLALTPDLLDKFYEIAVADDPDDPENTLEWLGDQLSDRSKDQSKEPLCEDNQNDLD